MKHEYEKVGDHWEEKESAGPSDSGAAGSRGSGTTEEGVDAKLYDETIDLRKIARGNKPR